MNRARPFGIIVLVLLALCVGASAGDDAASDDRDAASDVFWPMFAGNPARDGNSGISFPSATLGLLWKSPPPKNVYAYEAGQTGSSPCLVSAGGKHLVIVGSYDRSVYAYDAFSGRQQWQYTTGDGVLATPCYAEVGGKPMLFVVSSDRTIYALDPATGQELYSAPGKSWRYEVYPWSDTVAPAIVGDPMVADVDGRAVLFVVVWINDQKSEGNVQESFLYAINAADATLLWKAEIGKGTSAAPALGKVKDEPAVFVTHDAGVVFAFSARDGRPLWDEPFISQYDVRSGVSYGEVAGRRLLIFGSRLYSAFCIDADTGEMVWDIYLGTWMDSTPAIYYGGKRAVVVFGDYQQNLHAVDALTGEKLWRYRSYGYFSASPVLMGLAGEPVAAIPCLDNHLYIVNLNDGRFVFRAFTGKFLWSHFLKGDTVWPSAAAARLGGREILVVASYDGRVYVFGEGGQQVNVGAPSTGLVDAFGGSVAAMIGVIAILVAAVAYSAVKVGRKLAAQKRATVNDDN
jgi:outer membrane protein assembly factor BamB